MKKENWVWMGHAGHFILGHKCRFKLCTCVGKFIVSTVGEFVPENQLIDIIKPEFRNLKGEEKEYAYTKKYQCYDIGCDRKYETMIFRAKKSENKCCPYAITGVELDFLGYNKAEDAYKGHLKLCDKWSKRR